MINLEENYEFKKVEILLEAISMDDLKKFSNIFSTIESAISGYNLPSIENVLEMSREHLSSLMTKAKKEIKPGGSKQNMQDLVASAPPKVARKRRVILGRLIALQTSLVKLLRAIPTLMPLVSKEAKIEGKSLSGNLLNEITAAELASELGVSTMQIQHSAEKIQKGVVTQGSSEVPPEIAQELRNKIQSRKSQTGKVDTTPKEQQKLGAVLGDNGIERFRAQITNALNIKKGFMARIVNAIGFGDDLDEVLNPDNIVNDLINLTVEEFTNFAKQVSTVKNIQVGLSQQDAQQFAQTTKPQDSNAESTATSSENRQETTKISADDLYKMLSDPKAFPDFQRIKKPTMLQLIHTLRGKTIV